MLSRPRSATDAPRIESVTPHIKQVVLQNFMSHSNFKLDLGPSMNVIVGTNGSGKSSILTGIIIALGGRTKTTSRGDSLVSLVQTGKTRAIVSLKIHIPPDYRQMYQKYGNEVTVTREINSKANAGKGASSYKIKDFLGREVKGARAQDVKSICENFGFYPDNELAMLSQENAKEFLVSATPQVKYDKLRKALLQNVIEHDRALVNGHNSERSVLLERIELLKRSALEKEAKADEILNRARVHATASAQLKAIQLILAWRKADKAAHRVQSAVHLLEEQDSRLRELESHLNIDTRSEELESQRSSLIEQRTQLADQLNDLQGEHDQLERELSHAQAEFDRTSAEVNQLKGQASQLEMQIRDTESAAAKLTPEAVARRRAEIQKFINEADERQAEASAAMRMEDTTLSDLNETLLEYKDHFARDEKRVEEAKTRVKQLEAELRDVQKGNTAVPVTSENIRTLRSRVDRERWHRKPLGPLYHYVRMKDEGADFAPALETLWSRTLEGWWVETEADRRKLQSLSEECRVPNMRIIKRSDDPFDFSSAVPRSSSEYVRAVDVVDTDSEAILRILVDLSHIENLVLVRGTNTAFKVTSSRIPNNKATRALSLTMRDGGGRSYVSVSSLSGRTESANIEPMAQARMKVGAEARTRQLRAELQERNEELASAELQLKTTEQPLRNIERQIQEHTKARNSAESHWRHAEDDKDERRRELVDLETNAKSSDISAELDSTRKMLRSLNVQIREGREACDDQQDDIQDKKTTLAGKAATLRDMNHEVHELDKQLRHINRELQNMESSIRRHQASFERQKAVCEQSAAELRSLKVEHDEEVARAAELGPNPCAAAEQGDGAGALGTESKAFLDEPNAALREKLNRLKGQQEAISAEEGEIEAAYQMKETARREFEARTRDQNDMQRLGDEIKCLQRKREENEARAWDSIKQQIRDVFKQTLSKRSFIGDVEIDDKRTKLTATSTPGEASGRSTATLSGGEKSFTQVALLMAVWKTMHVGFVAMDEYDVYMDKANRSLTLLSLAEVVTTKEIQCVLITPQDIDTRSLDGMQIKVHKLAPARPST